MLRSWTTGMTGLVCLACCGCQTGSNGMPQFSTGGSAAISASTSVGAISRPQPVQVSQSVQSPTDDSAVIIKPGDTLRMRESTPPRLTPVTGEPPSLLPVKSPVSTNARGKTVQAGTARIPSDVPGESLVHLTGQQQRLPAQTTRQRSPIGTANPALTVEMLESNRPLANVVSPRKLRSTAHGTSIDNQTVRSRSSSSNFVNGGLKTIRETPRIQRLPPVLDAGPSRDRWLPQSPIPIYPEVQPPMAKTRKPSREDL